MHRHLQNPRIAKIHRCYDVVDVQRLYDCHRNTVYNWIDNGLRPIDDRYPILFHGSSLNEFHSRRHKSGKRPCGPGEVYCVVCRTPQSPAGGAVDYDPLTTKTGTITAICPTCDRLIQQRVGNQRLAEFQVRMAVNFRTKKDA